MGEREGTASTPTDLRVLLEAQDHLCSNPLDLPSWFWDHMSSRVLHTLAVCYQGLPWSLLSLGLLLEEGVSPAWRWLCRKGNVDLVCITLPWKPPQSKRWDAKDPLTCSLLLSLASDFPLIPHGFWGLNSNASSGSPWGSAALFYPLIRAVLCRAPSSTASNKAFLSLLSKHFTI